jgi:hypothetical protein
MDKMPTGSHQSSESTPEGVDWAEIRRQIKHQVVREAGEMVAAAIVRAKTGHCQIMKYLFELAGLYPQAAEENGGDDFSLARTLCERLGLPPVPNAAPDAVEADVLEASESTAGRGNGHALK